ncbi:hypothetical protein WJX82_000945 [Trebouxia sp. C0006]
MVLAPSIFAQNYVVERHLSTKTPYEQRQSLSRGNSPAYSPKHGSSQPLFTYWLARHGTRWPTQKRMQQIQELQNVFKLAGQEAEQAHPWVNKWTNPFKDSIHLAGHLHPKGVKEMQHMGQDFKKYLLAVKDQELLVSVEVHATAKARTQDSAKAFMQGLYGGTHTYTDCQAYDEYVAQTDADFLDAWKQQEWCAHIPRLAEGLGLDPGMLTGRHVDALWHLCQQEAGLWNITHQACSLFPSQEAQHMEWVDDVQLFMRKGAASPVAYNMAAPLLADIATSLQEAAAGTGRSGLHAKLTFGNPGEAMQSWAPPLPKPPKPRKWHGSMIAPYGANIQATKKQGGGHCVEVLYNGKRVELPGCHHTQGLCSLESFLETTQSQRSPTAFNHACRI